MQNFIDWLTQKENQDDLPFEMTREDILNWVKRIHELLISEGKNEWDGKHYGDCVKQNVSCQICLYQNWLDGYEKYCREYVKNN